MNRKPWRTSRGGTAAVLVLVSSASLLVSSAGVAGAAPEPPGFVAKRYASDLDHPTDLVWEKGTKRLFVTEQRTGRVRIITGGRLRAQPCVDLNVATFQDQGLQGITLHPDFETNHFLYVFFTKKNPLENRVTRFTVADGKCINPHPIVTGLGVGDFHQGGQLLFKGTKLFITTGDNHNAALAQNVASRQGKTLRYNPNGSVPGGNPTWGGVNPSPVWSMGHRNGFGLALRPGTGEIYETENGEHCDDELNLIEKEKNYGWGPGYECASEPGEGAVGPNPVPPLFLFNGGATPVAPTDAWWYTGRLDALAGALYAGDFNRGRLHRFDFDPDVSHRIVYDSPRRIIGVGEGPGRWLYLVARPHVYRLVPGLSAVVNVGDDFFSRKQSKVEVGGFTRWRRVTSSSGEHNVHSKQGLFSSGAPTTGEIDFTATFSAGTFPYICDVHAFGGMKGRVEVPPTLTSAPDGKPFTVKWATLDTDTGGTFDVQYRVGNSDWTTWKTNAERPSGVFGKNGNPVTLRSGRTYSFRARSGRGTGSNSGYSPVVNKQI